MYDKKNLGDNENIFFSARKGSSTGNYGFRNAYNLDSSLFSLNNDLLTILEDGNYKFNIIIANSDTASSKPKIDIVKNDEIVYSEYGLTGDTFVVLTTNIKLSKDDILKMNIYGPGNVYTVFLTAIYKIG